MQIMSDTPRTNARVKQMIDNDQAPEGLEYWARNLERENNELVRLGNQLCDWLESLTQETHMSHLCLDQRRTLKQDIKNWKAFQ